MRAAVLRPHSGRGRAAPALREASTLAYLREAGTTVYHPCSTVRMGSDDRAPLDTQLRLRGVEGLRVVDASVFPLVPSSNIHPAVLMTAERAAEMIRAG